MRGFFFLKAQTKGFKMAPGATPGATWGLREVDPGLVRRPRSAYVSLWLDMPSPGTVKSGYELRFTKTSALVYSVSLAMWVGGAKTALAKAEPLAPF
jgi:hypothetical protein